MTAPRMPRFSRAALLAAALVAGPATAFPQSFNIDIGAVASGQPASSYAGAGNQPGHWNGIDASSVGVSFVIDDLAGVPTGITVSYQLVGNGQGNFQFNAPATTGDDELLMDDLMDIGNGTSITAWTFLNMTPGAIYDVYTYAWAPDSPTNYKSAVNVPLAGVPPQVLGGKLWPGALFYPHNYLRQRYNGSKLVVSRACSDRFPIRWGCPREIVLCLV